ncbi:hypothetical protein SKUL_46 [Pseudomonas phage Skulduggery]|uniref:Fe2OG dioxygenase domain-containing protein n=1 Tax=Pseudomonas phage Skulduggery TaxID=2006671 RepID=A0A1Y0SX99_9CAUD|nr:2OG-Fe(II) oxygenase [Pseudomonas phage Skulduggery]ARV77145.1 hypothetical protein SKUL_46 [Pseudomonas phage Skulduggery]
MHMLKLLHPEFAYHAPRLLEIIAAARELNPEPDQLAALIDEDEQWLESYGWAMTIIGTQRVTTSAGCVYAVPFLNEGACDALVQLAARLEAEHGYRPNAAEERDYQIPEIVVKHYDKGAYAELRGLLEYLNIWFQFVYYTAPNFITSIQFTKYEPSDTPRGNWHHDRDSDFTAVVSLAPELHEGGGTDVRLTPTAAHRVPKLPKGFALLFNGKQVQHRGAPVESGTRHLLTFWLDSQGTDPV